VLKVLLLITIDDSFLSASSNYYLYRHQSSPIAGQWSMIPHDFDQVLHSNAARDIYTFLKARSSKSPMVARLLQIPAYNTTFQNAFRTFVTKIFGSGRKSGNPSFPPFGLLFAHSLILNIGICIGAVSPATRYEQMFDFTYTMIKEDKYWALSNGVSDYSSYRSSAFYVINYLPNRQQQIQSQIDSWSPSNSDSGLTAAAKWGIGIAVVVVLGVIMYCCWYDSLSLLHPHPNHSPDLGQFLTDLTISSRLAMTGAEVVVANTPMQLNDWVVQMKQTQLDLAILVEAKQVIFSPGNTNILTLLFCMS
jgi:hypothetical protein